MAGVSSADADETGLVIGEEEVRGGARWKLDIGMGR